MKHILKVLSIASILGVTVSIAKQNNISFNNRVETNYLNAITGDDKVNEVLSLIDLNVDKDRIVTDIKLPCQGLYGVTITWTSSNENVIVINTVKNNNGKVTSITGKVTRDANEDKTVELTATASYVEGETTFSGTKVITVKVLKASAIAAEEIPLAFNEDFSSYEKDIDIGNYNKWTISGSLGLANIRDKISSNINNNYGDKMLEITSKRISGNITYSSKLNANTTNVTSQTDGSHIVAFEFGSLFEGNINGVNVNVYSNTKAIFSISIKKDGYYLTYRTPSSSLDPEKLQIDAKEGIWYRIRAEINIDTGYYKLYYYDFENSKYVDLTTTLSKYDTEKNAIYGNKMTNSTLDKIEFSNLSGTSSGTTYISDFQLDDIKNLPLETKLTDPNRSEGIGLIKNYDDIVCGFKGDASLDVEPEFQVHNRFNEDQTFTKGTDYTIANTVKSEETTFDSYVTYTKTYTLTLKSTGEQKNVVQTFYVEDSKSVTPRISNFKASYLKTVTEKDADGNPITDTEGKVIEPTTGYITISGNVYRNDATVYYKVVDAGASAPSVSELKEGTAYTFGNGIDSDTKVISIDTPNQYLLTNEYDVYALVVSEGTDSIIYSSKSISTVVNVSTPEDLYDMQTNYETRSSTFRMINDIDCSNYTWEFSEELAISFTGVFDGQGYTIKGFNILTTSAKAALFKELKGTVKNVTFKDADIQGSSDSAVIAGQMMCGTIENVNIIDCKVSMPASVSSSEGYYAGLVGRFRGDGNVSNIKNINISNLDIEANKYIGLLTGGVGGSNHDVTVNISNIYVEGKVNTEGAAVGLIGRNRGKTTINNAVIFLDVVNAKKEVGAVAGHNKEGGSLTVNNIVSDLKIKQLTQVTYFNNFIGSHDSNTSSYSGSNVYYLHEDYSDLSESITPTTTAISFGRELYSWDINDKTWWEQNTFLTDFNVDLNFEFSSSMSLPQVKVREESDIVVTADMYNEYVSNLANLKVNNYRYNLFKANNVYKYLSESDKQLDTVKALKAKYDAYLSAYEEYVNSVNAIDEDVDDVLGLF